MVKVVRARDAQDLMMARQVSEREARIRSNTIQIPGEDVLTIRRVLDSAIIHHLHRDHANAALHLESVRRSPLTNQLISARDRLEKILADSIPKDPVPQPEGSSETPKQEVAGK